MEKAIILALAEPFTPEQTSSGGPTGSDAKQFESFELLSQELARLTNPSDRGIDWQIVEEQSLIILNSQSKDLRVASYLTGALYYRQSFQGLTYGIELLTAILEQDYWDELFPQRAKRQDKLRAAGLEWLSTILDKALEAHQFTEKDDFEHLLLAGDAVKQLDEKINVRFQQYLPKINDLVARFRSIRPEVEAWLAASKPQPPEPEPKLEAGSETKSNLVVEKIKSAASSVIEAITPTPKNSPATDDLSQIRVVTQVDKSQIDKALDTSGQSLAAIAQALDYVNSLTPHGFYLARTAKWMQLTEAPASGTMPANPSGERLERLTVQLQQGEYQALIQDAEQLFNQGAIFNLNLQRLVVLALDGLQKVEAREMVVSCLLQLIKRLPTMVTNQFSGSVPFADEITQIWLEGLTQSDVSAQSVDSQQPWEAALLQAKQLLVDENIEQAFLYIQEQAVAATGLRQQAYWQLTQAKLSMSGGYLSLALGQLETLEQLVDTTTLAAWDPQLRIAIVTELLHCHDKLNATAPYTDQQLQIIMPLYHELCSLAPVAALSIKLIAN